MGHQPALALHQAYYQHIKQKSANRNEDSNAPFAADTTQTERPINKRAGLPALQRGALPFCYVIVYLII